ncbi:hypothetical protein ACQJBY_005735 [Aegilops geniculata]
MERRSKMPGVLYYRRVPPSEPREPASPSSPETQFVGDEYSPSSLPLLDQSPNMWSDSEDYAPNSPEWHSSDDEMVQNRQLYDYEGRLQRQSDDYANLALDYYNNDEKNEIKYELIKAIISSAMRNQVLYGHVNFIAKGTLKNSKEEFFFAELRYKHDVGDYVPTCIVALEENERVDGFGGTESETDRMTKRIDNQHCYACGELVKHPADGSLYEAGHIANHCCYGHWY